MLTLIKLIHTLNRRIDQTTANLEDRSKVRLHTICAVLALSLSSMGSIPAGANTLDRSGIRHSLQLQTPSQIAQNPQPQATPAAPAAPATPVAPVAPVPPTPASNAGGKLLNNLKLPEKASDVQITTTKDISLQEALDLAFRNNREVQAARLTVDKSLASVREAEAAKSLQIGLNSTLQAQGAPLLTERAPNQITDIAGDIQGRVEATYSLINQPLDKRIKSASKQVEFDKFDLRRIEQRLKGEVITAYYDLQQADSTSIINQATIKDATRSLSDAQLQEKAGVGTKFDILRAQVLLATANQDLSNSQGQQATARKKIAQLLSIDENTEFRSSAAVRELGAWDKSLEDSILIAFKNRPELAQQLARKDILSFQDEIRGDDSAQVGLFANYNLSKTITNNNPLQDGYSFGARLNWNFWDGGGSSARAKQRSVTDEISDNQFTTERNRVRFEVEQAYSNLGTSRKNIVTSTQALKQAEESLKLARLRFQAGVGTQTDVIQAQTELARVRGNRVSAILNYNRALSGLRTATVTEWGLRDWETGWFEFQKTQCLTLNSQFPPINPYPLGKCLKNLNNP